MGSHTYYNDIIGRIRISEDGGSIVEIEFARNDDEVVVPEVTDCTDTELLDAAYKEIEEYLNGLRQEFTFPIKIHGTPFQQSVWRALMDIPYGETRTYKEIAEAVGNPKAVRAVGGANNSNKLPIVIPCHRVVGSNGKLVGYAGGVEIKEKLLAAEGVVGLRR